jgi:hypothetical protein
VIAKAGLAWTMKRQHAAGLNKGGGMEWWVVTDQGQPFTRETKETVASAFHFYYPHRPDGKSGRWGIHRNDKKSIDICRV